MTASTSADSQPWLKNIVFSLWLVESQKAETKDLESQLCVCVQAHTCVCKQSAYKWTCAIQTYFVQGSTVVWKDTYHFQTRLPVGIFLFIDICIVIFLKHHYFC